MKKVKDAKADSSDQSSVDSDQCGGWSKDGIACENCIADAEGRPRPNVWEDAERYEQAMKEYQEKLKRLNDEDEA